MNFWSLVQKIWEGFKQTTDKQQTTRSGPPHSPPTKTVRLSIRSWSWSTQRVEIVNGDHEWRSGTPVVPCINFADRSFHGLAFKRRSKLRRRKLHPAQVWRCQQGCCRPSWMMPWEVVLVYGLKYFLLAFDKNWFSTVASRDVQSGVLGGGSRASYNALCSESDSKLDKNHLMDISCYNTAKL